MVVILDIIVTKDGRTKVRELKEAAIKALETLKLLSSFTFLSSEALEAISKNIKDLRNALED